MKRFMFILLVFLATSTLAKEIQSESKVASATVFRNRAMVVREASVNVSKGQNTIKISEMTSDLLDETVRVSVQGNFRVKILDVNVERQYTIEIQKERIRYMQAKIDSLEELKKAASDQLAILESKKAFVESLKAESVKLENQKMLLEKSTVQDWSNMLGFVDTNLNAIYKDMRKQNQHIKELDEEIAAIQQNMRQTQRDEAKDFKEIFIELDADRAASIVLDISYITQSASWYPTYDARVDIDDQTIELSYYAMVQQSTGEDWQDVDLDFSTAEPLSVKSIPELQRWYLNTRTPALRRSRPSTPSAPSASYPRINVDYTPNFGLANGIGAISGYVRSATDRDPLPGANLSLQGTRLGAASDRNGKFYIANVPMGSYQLDVNVIGYGRQIVKVDVLAKQTASLNITLAEQALEGEAVTVMAERNTFLDQSKSFETGAGSLEKEKAVYTQVEQSELATTFKVPVKSSVPGDNNTHKVTLAIDEMPVSFDYTSIPKKVPAVFLKGKAANTNDYPLLEGNINVFVDNEFVNKTYLKNIVPTDTLELTLGVDNHITVEKNLINKFTENKGLIKGSRKITYEYEIVLKNNRKTEKTIRLYDQLPIPMDEKIKVELIEPDKEMKDLSNDRKLDWTLKIKAGEEKKIPLKYVVEFPQNLSVYGLE